jgi:hypothetical protein
MIHFGEFQLHLHRRSLRNFRRQKCRLTEAKLTLVPWDEWKHCRKGQQWFRLLSLWGFKGDNTVNEQNVNVSMKSFFFRLNQRHLIWTNCKLMFTQLQAVMRYIRLLLAKQQFEKIGKLLSKLHYQTILTLPLYYP